MKNIFEVASLLNLPEDKLIPYGYDKAKIDLSIMKDLEGRPNGKYVLVTSALNANAAGEGKTSTEIGLNDGLNAIGVKSVACLREPSLGVCFGNKGTATGALKASVVPDDINYFFTGDIPAMTITVNMIAAQIDNVVYQGNTLNIDPDRIVWNRATDICDRSLRSITTAQDDKKAVPHHCEYVITVAHELSTIMTLAENEDDFVEKLDKAIVAYTYGGKEVTVGDLRMNGCIRRLIREALKPNLVQSLEGNPVIVHGTPFANISVGTNSVVATKLARKLADVVVVESGFGSDCGGEKNLDLVCPKAGIDPSAIVAVVSCRSLKLHGGQDKSELDKENVEAVRNGLPNMIAHIKHLKRYGLPLVVAINRFSFDTDAELAVIESWLDENGVDYAISEAPLKGAEGGVALAKKVMEKLDAPETGYVRLYDWDMPIKDKIAAICEKCYGASGVEYAEDALRQIEEYEAEGYGSLPICISKTPASITDDQKILGAPADFKIHIRELRLFKGAGFIVALSGSLLMLPGLGKLPRLSDDYGRH